mmetsp:Transcript_9609/g.28214  ORF Transcript_9609/g.28214 Transcript_9609/m.28214 type:complete len:207 (-) Transcript_9609:2722-3342(-)
MRRKRRMCPPFAREGHRRALRPRSGVLMRRLLHLPRVHAGDPGAHSRRERSGKRAERVDRRARRLDSDQRARTSALRGRRQLARRLAPFLPWKRRQMLPRGQGMTCKSIRVREGDPDHARLRGHRRDPLRGRDPRRHRYPRPGARYPRNAGGADRPPARPPGVRPRRRLRQGRVKRRRGRRSSRPRIPLSLPSTSLTKPWLLWTMR